LIQIKFPARRSRLERAGAVVQLWPARGVASGQVGFLIGPANIVFYVLVGIPMARLVDIYPRKIALACGISLGISRTAGKSSQSARLARRWACAPAPATQDEAVAALRKALDLCPTAWESAAVNRRSLGVSGAPGHPA
jgi:hypothetical protein